MEKGASTRSGTYSETISVTLQPVSQQTKGKTVLEDTPVCHT